MIRAEVCLPLTTAVIVSVCTDLRDRSLGRINSGLGKQKLRASGLDKAAEGLEG